MRKTIIGLGLLSCVMMPQVNATTFYEACYQTEMAILSGIKAGQFGYATPQQKVLIDRSIAIPYCECLTRSLPPFMSDHNYTRDDIVSLTDSNPELDKRCRDEAR
jgi:hypothetical protein